MVSFVAQEKRAEGLALVAAGLGMLEEAGFKPRDEVDAVGFVKDLERVRRRTESMACRLLGEIERFDLHRDDGYGSAKTMVAHHARLSKAEVTTRHRTAKVCVELPDLGEAFASGAVPVANMTQLGRLAANPRVRDKMADEESWFVAKATELAPAYFRTKMKIWEDLNDSDGPEPAAERCHRNRRYLFAQQFDKSFMGEHSHGSMQGSEMHVIFQHYFDAETLADWETARAEHGDNTTDAHLPRTAAQRAADALYRIYLDAAANPDGPVPAQVVHNIVWNQETFEYFLNMYFGDPQDTMDPDQYLCETVDGTQLNPYEALTSALVSRLRRAVVGADSAVIDLGLARNFTGGARAAVKLSSSTCIWPSCHVPSSKCETDHVKKHSKMGRTDPSNGAVLCGKHNRWKQKGFRVWKDPTGIWHTYRPNGTEIEP